MFFLHNYTPARMIIMDAIEIKIIMLKVNLSILLSENIYLQNDLSLSDLMAQKHLQVHVHPLTHYINTI